MFKLSDVLKTNELHEIVKRREAIIPYDLYIELANCLGTLPTEEQQKQFYQERTGTELTKGED